MRTTLAALLGVFTLTVALAAAPSPFAVQGHTMYAERNHHALSVSALSDLGVGMFRDEIFWGRVETERGVYQIPREWNENLTTLDDATVDLLLILNYMNPLYDNGLAPHTDEGRAAFAAFCEFVARQTRGRVNYFEIWNEPNVDGFWHPQANAADYAALLAAAYPAIKRGNPDAIVLGGATSGIPMDFLRTVFENGGHDAMDALSVHPYTSPTPPEKAGVWAQLEAARAMTAEFGEPLDIWITEVGFPTEEGGVSERDQANMIARIHARARTIPWLRTVTWYWLGPDGPDRANPEDNFGLYRPGWTRKPSARALEVVIEQLLWASPEKSLKVGDGIEAHVFTLPEGGEHSHVTALWSWDEIHHVEITTENPVVLVNRDGDEVTLNPHRQTLYLDVSDSPIYLRSTEPLTAIVEADEPAVFIEQDRMSMTSQERSNLTLRFQGDDVASSEEGVAPQFQGFPVSVRPLDDPRFDSDEDIKAIFTEEGEITAVLSLSPRPDLPRGDHLVTVLLNGPGGTMGRLAAHVHVLEPVEIEILPRAPERLERPEFSLEFVNNTSTRPEGEINVVPPEGIRVRPPRVNLIELRPRGSMQRRFEIMTPQPPDAVIPFDLEMVMDNGETHTERRHVSFLTSPRVAASPEIDGDLSDWTGGDPIRLNSQEQIDHQSEPWDGPEDSSALVWTAWSDDWLFIAAEVRDDIMSDPSEGFAVYNNDGIEVYLDTELARDQARTRYSADDHQIGLFNQRGAAVVYHLTRQAEIASAEIVINRMPTPSQTRSRNRCDYIIEAAIPTAAIDLTPEAGTPIGFNVALIDDDDPTSVHPFGQEIHMVWTGLRNSWRNPRQFGQLTLTEPARE